MIRGSYHGYWGVEQGYWEPWTPDAVKARPSATVATIDGIHYVETAAGIKYRRSNQPEIDPTANINPDIRNGEIGKGW